MNKAHKLKNGFTLIEVILAITLGGIIMASTMTLFVTFLQIWNEDKDKKAFIETIDGTTSFLHKLLNAPQTVIVNGNAQQIAWKKLKASNSLNGGEVLTFTSRITPMCMRNSTLSRGPITLYLAHEGKLLLLGWQGIKVDKSKLDANEESATKEFSGKFVISNIVKDFHYAYMDKKNGSWRFEKEPLKSESISDENGTPLLPNGIRLIFKDNDMEETRFIPISNFYSTTNQQKPNKE